MMDSSPTPSPPHYVQPNPTIEQCMYLTPFPYSVLTILAVDYADLAVIDLSKASTLNGRVELAREAVHALHESGFFYIINHGYTREQTARLFDIADIPFSQVSEQEKQKYLGRMKETGSYEGYKLRGYNHIGNGVRDQIEHYNLLPDVTRREHPESLRPFLGEIENFAKHYHYNILHPILRLLAIGLELPEDTLVNMHSFAGDCGSWIRFMKYYPRSESDEQKSKNVWFKGHTDFGGITILYSQPVSGLQILSKDGAWKWVRHIENALVINSGDTMEFLSGGYYRPTIHRVVQPPTDQRGYCRLGVFIFTVPNDDVKLEPLLESPVLKRIGTKIDRINGEDPPTTVRIWRKMRVAAYGQTELKAAPETGVEQEIVSGVLVKHYN
ncbi:hypothetical protein BDQ17DRAFT_783244 [Cyathus striatus]|nr:hypothetical protein BDQ17DRAFT_783244 [Cyathus striatus]